MKKLLIHNDNTNLVDSFDTTIKVVFSNDVDRYIDDSIINKLEKEDFNIIYIKDNLSSNYLELYGLRVAYHIRLSDRLKDKKFVPIVILSDIDEIVLNRLEPMARILFTKNIFLIKNSKEAFDDFKDRDLKDLTQKEYRNSFLNLIDIEAPENSTSHNIANEWAIYRWAEFLKVESRAIQSNNTKISSMLYFKYLLAKNHIKKDRAIGCKRVKHSGKILYIDDEWQSGWSDIFESYFAKGLDIDFETFEYEFKDKNIFQVKIDIQKRVKEYNPDLVILDLRLIENDHKNINREDISKYTGIQVLEDIKKINQGIQVLMLTATSKSVILDKLYEYDILGYIKKEHPIDRNITTKENLNKLADLVDKGFEKSYLKEIWDIQNTILELDLFKKDDEFFNKIKLEISTIFEILNSNIENKLKFTLITIFKVLEILTEIYNLKGNEYIKIKSLFHKYNLTNYDSNISQIVCTRNFLVHSGNLDKLAKACIDTLIKEPNTIHILTWFKMLQTILEKVSNDKPNN
jgi:CheY-like chemotaxis protein